METLGIKEQSSRKDKKHELIETYKKGLFGVGIGLISLFAVRPYEQGQFGVTPPEITHGYMHDSLSSVALAYFLRMFSTDKPSANAAAGFIIPSVLEVLQKLNIYEGTFDPKDFVAYGLGASTYYAVERFRGRKKVDMQPGEEYSVNPNIDQALK